VQLRRPGPTLPGAPLHPPRRPALLPDEAPLLLRCHPPHNLPRGPTWCASSVPSPPRLRPLVVPRKPAGAPQQKGSVSGPAVPARPSRVPWAELLKRTFEVDVLTCDTCGGKRRVVASSAGPSPPASSSTSASRPGPSPALAPRDPPSLSCPPDLQVQPQPPDTGQLLDEHGLLRPQPALPTPAGAAYASLPSFPPTAPVPSPPPLLERPPIRS
jgi:hypothetical protein